MNSASQNSNTYATEQRGILSTIDLLELLWRRKYPIGNGMLIGILLGALFYLMTPTKFESEAGVLLVPKRPQAMTKDQQYESGFEDFVATHRALIVSPLIVNRAIEASDFRSLKIFAEVDPEEVDLADVVIQALEAGGGSRDLGDNADSIMTLAFRGTDAEECPLVVQGIVDSYQSFLDETYRGMSDDVLQLIGKASDLLRNDLQEQENLYVDFRQQSPLVARGTDEVNPLQDRLVAIETQRSGLLILRIEVQGQLTVIENAKRGGYDEQQLLTLVAGMRQRAERVDGLLGDTSTTLDSQLIQLADREQQLLEHYGPKHPHVATVRERMVTTRKLQALPTMAHVPQSTTEKEPTRGDAAEMYVQFLRQELDRIDASEQLLAKLYQREHALAKELAGFQLKDERHQRDITRTQQLYDEVISQLQEASLVKGLGGFEARVIAPPKLGEKASPSLKIVGAGSLFLGLCFGFGLALFMEVTDNRFHSREEIQARLGSPILGEVPQFEAADGSNRASDSDASLGPMLCSHFQPQSPQSEAIRALRTALFFSNRGQDLRVVQVTSPSVDDGASTLAANLAISLAHLGRRVVLVDADLHGPRHQEIFGVTARTGLCSAIAGDVSLSNAISATAVGNLWLLPMGTVPSDGSELLASPHFNEMLGALREQYDCVLIDSGPLLAAAYPGALATQVDGVVLTLRPTSDSRQRADRAKQILDTLDVRMVGVVVNGVGDAASRGYQ